MADNTSSMNNSFDIVESKLNHEPKPIELAHSTPKPKPRPKPQNTSLLIFSHGAGGDMNSSAITNFRDGFAPSTEITTFNSTTSLPARTKQFATLIASETSNREIILGGRSMGARSAVLAATESKGRCKRLVLVSYPLHTEKRGGLELRDRILLDLPAECEVLFVSGERDSMCDFERLEGVRGRMRAGTWLIVVRGANHGMEMRPRAATGEVGKCTGEVAARWVRGEGRGVRESEIVWDAEGGVAVWSAEGGEGKLGKELIASSPNGKAADATADAVSKGEKGSGSVATGTKQQSRKHGEQAEDGVASRTRSRTKT